jgi:hypothetical protein
MSYGLLLGTVASSRQSSIELSLVISGGGGAGGWNSGTGGAGGRSTGTLVASRSETLAIVCGQGGNTIPASGGTGTRPVGGGGLAGTVGYGGQGGGYSGIFLSSVAQGNSLLIAGGGGGAAWEGANGGAGGGSVGANGGAGNISGGTGGTQTAGGTGGSGTIAGSALQGGDPHSSGDSGGGGGGGGGYFGGGPGHNNNPGSAGGGGSSFASGTRITSAVLTQGSGGRGGIANALGADGMVTISYPATAGVFLSPSAGLSWVFIESGGTRTYTFYAGTGTVTFSTIQPTEPGLPVTSGLRFWVDASDASTFSYSSGTSISQWRDKSGNSLHFNQSVSASQPTRNTTIGSRSAVKFDGTDDYIAVDTNPASLMGSSARTFFVAMQLETIANVQNILYYGDMSNFLLWQLCIANFDNPMRLVIHHYAAGIGESGSDVIPINSPQVVGSGTDGSNNILFRGARIYRQTQALNTTTPDRGISLGEADRAYGGAYYGWPYSGRIGEAIGYSSNLSGRDRNTVNNYLAAKWGATL